MDPPAYVVPPGKTDVPPAFQPEHHVAPGLGKSVAELKAEREKQGLTLGDIELRSGLKRSALSRLENSSDGNPTLLTVQRYAVSLGLTLTTLVHSPS